MLFVGDKEVHCKGCGAFLEQTNCLYCGTESNFVFMTLDEKMELVNKCWNFYTPVAIYQEPKFYKGKRIVIKLGD